MFVLLSLVFSFPLLSQHNVNDLDQQLTAEAEFHFNNYNEEFITIYNLVERLPLDSIEMIVKAIPAQGNKAFVLSYLS